MSELMLWKVCWFVVTVSFICVIVRGYHIYCRLLNMEEERNNLFFILDQIRQILSYPPGTRCFNLPTAVNTLKRDVQVERDALESLRVKYDELKQKVGKILPDSGKTSLRATQPQQKACDECTAEKPDWAKTMLALAEEMDEVESGHSIALKAYVEEIRASVKYYCNKEKNRESS